MGAYLRCGVLLAALIGSSAAQAGIGEFTGTPTPSVIAPPTTPPPRTPPYPSPPIGSYGPGFYGANLRHHHHRANSGAPHVRAR